MMMITTMETDYVSELRATTSLLFISQVIYEHGEPRWNDVDRGNLAICSSQLSGNPIKSSSTKAVGMGEGNYKSVLANYVCSYLQVIFNVP
jgi:hypothetical protein